MNFANILTKAIDHHQNISHKKFRYFIVDLNETWIRINTFYINESFPFPDVKNTDLSFTMIAYEELCVLFIFKFLEITNIFNLGITMDN